MSEELLLARFNRVILFSQPQKKAIGPRPVLTPLAGLCFGCAAQLSATNSQKSKYQFGLLPAEARLGIFLGFAPIKATQLARLGYSRQKPKGIRAKNGLRSTLISVRNNRQFF